MSPGEGDFLCDGWVWDPALRELRHHRRKGKGWEPEPDNVQRLRPVTAVTWHRWSQAPMATSTGRTMPGSLSRIVVEYAGGGNLTINENDRACSEKIARTVADAYGLEVVLAGAPDGRRGGNLPLRDALGRLRNRSGGMEVLLDEAAGEIIVRKRRFTLGFSTRRLRTTEMRRLELTYVVRGPLETFTVWAIVGRDEERLPVASYTGYEGWADVEEWRQFARELGRSLGVDVRLDA